MILINNPRTCPARSPKAKYLETKIMSPLKTEVLLQMRKLGYLKISSSQKIDSEKSKRNNLIRSDCHAGSVKGGFISIYMHTHENIHTGIETHGHTCILESMCSITSGQIINKKM